MGGSKLSSAGGRRLRRWTFAACIFDEANWALIVQGRRVAVETKPLELLRELLVNAGNVVSKDELLDKIWPDVTVVEASLPTAVHKLRAAIRDQGRKQRIIQTVSSVGYRIAVPVKVEELPVMASKAVSAALPSPAVFAASPNASRSVNSLAPRLLSISAAVAVVLAALAVATTPPQIASAFMPTVRKPASISQGDAAAALRKLDVARVEALIAAGWDPNAHFDKVETTGLTYLLNMCEWDAGHDRRRMLMMARTLIEGGADIEHRNVFGDTPYSIAKAPRYCGPDHPVTQMLEAMCYGGDMGPKDLCLATYELNAEQRLAQGLPPKSKPKRRRA